MFSRLQAELGQEALHGGEHGVVAAAGAPAHLLVGGELLAVLRAVGGRDARGSPGNGQLGRSSERLLVGGLDGRLGRRSVRSIRSVIASASSAALQRQAAHVVVADDVDEVLRAQQHARAGRGSSRAPAPRRSACSIVAEVRRERVEVAQVRLGDRAARPCGPGGTAAPIGPYVEPQPSTSTFASPDGSSTSSGGRTSAIRSTLACAGADHEVVVGRVVGDVAVAVALLQAADAVLEARRCRGPPTAGPGSPRRAGRARTRRLPVRVGSWLGSVAKAGSIAGQVGDLGDLPRLGAVGEVAVGEQHHRGAVGDRDPGRLERGVEAVGRATAARRSAPAPRRCGRTSPAAGRPARSWSAGRSTGRRAARRRRAAAARSSRRGRSSRTSARCRGRRWW